MHNLQSPRADDDGIEAEIIAKGLTAPRLTPADIEAVISSEHYFTGAAGAAHQTAVNKVDFSSDAAMEPLCCLTFCVLVLNNGFTVSGESACVSPANFDAEIGRKVARGNAVQKVWALEGYLLKQRLLQDELLTPTPTEPGAQP